MGIVGVGGVFLLDGIAGTARAQSGKRITGSGNNLIGIEVARVGAAALNHEVGNIAMELQVVVEALASKLNEVAHMNGRIIACKLHADCTLGSLDDGNLAAVRLILGGIHSHAHVLLLLPVRSNADTHLILPCKGPAGCWCPLQDSNLRLSAPEADALSPELRGHISVRNYTLKCTNARKEVTCVKK